jgi:hypothetical protein
MGQWRKVSRLCYRSQPVNYGCGDNQRLFWEQNKIRTIFSVGKIQSCLKLKQVVPLYFKELKMRHRKPWCSWEHPCFVFGRLRVRIPVTWLAIPRFLSFVISRQLPPTFYFKSPIAVTRTFCYWHCIISVDVTSSLNNARKKSHIFRF